MARLTFVVVALIVALAMGNQNKQHKLDAKQSLVELNRNALGNSILSVVQLATATGESTDEINLLLQNIAADLNAQQTVADSVSENDEATCTKLTNDISSAISYHTIQIVAVQKQLDDSTEALDEAETEVRQATGDLDDNEDNNESEAALRAQQHASFLEHDREHELNIEAVDEASKIVQHLQAGVSFSQLKSRFEKVHAQLASSKHVLFKPLIASLTQLAAKVDPKQIVKILDLLSQIRQQIVASRNNINNIEDRQASDYANQSNHLSEENKRLTERKAFLEDAIVSYKGVITGATQSIEDHTIGLEDAQEGLDIQDVYCATQAETYENSSNNREQQLAAIERLQDLLINKGGAISDFLDEREDVQDF